MQAFKNNNKTQTVYARTQKQQQQKQTEPVNLQLCGTEWVIHLSHILI